MPRKSRPVKADAGALGKVAAAIEAGDFPTALAEALKAWRASRGAELADLVDALGTRSREVTIAGHTAIGFQASWLRLAEGKPSPVAIGALAASIGKLIPIARTTNYVDRDIKRYRAFLDRIAVLEMLPADPRMASAITGLLERAPFTIESGRRIYQPAIDLLTELGDPRVVPRLRALVAQPTSKAALVRAYFAEALPPAADAIETAAHLGSADTRATARALTAAIAKPTANGRGDVDALMAECLAHPDDDGPREVLADVLLEREDPRGEFIALQLRAARGEVSEVERKRMTVLLRTHERAWLGGDLAAITKHRWWRRGFLDEAELQRNAAADKATWARAAKDPKLATIRKLAKGGANAAHYKAFMLSPAMCGLREIGVLSIEMLDAIGADRKLEILRVEHNLTDDAFDAFAAIDRCLERTGATRLCLVYRRAPPDVLVSRIAANVTGRERLRELRAVAACHAAMLRWSVDPWTWLGAHAALGVSRLVLELDTLQIVAERTTDGLALEIDAAGDWLLESVLRDAPKLASVVLRGGRPAMIASPGVRMAFARLRRKLTTFDCWVSALRDPDRAKRARRS